jgi:FKBP-type peptidyl-prolyl cis-trans isomerase FkpA/FKBP-type peptidyl-prolyl cis-trans isomerase FklB
MKFLVLLALVGLVACNGKPKSDLKSDKARLSYAIGQEIGRTIKMQEIEVDVNALAMSINDVVEGKPSALTQEDLQKARENFEKGRQEKMVATAEKNKKEGDDFLAKNKTAEGWKTTASGLQIKTVTPGKGASPKDSSTVVVHYAGKLIDGTEFDSSIKRGQPAEFPVKGVIPGWTEALKLMKVGEKAQLAIPSQLAYGPQGRPGIPPNSVLLFDVELIGIKK